jgi:hypothetical protein
MARIECSECDVTSNVTSESQEPVVFCPFCGADVNIPFDDDDDDFDDDWLDEDDEADEEDDY